MKMLEIREPPITLELAKQHLRIGNATHDDALIAANSTWLLLWLRT